MASLIQAVPKPNPAAVTKLARMLEMGVPRASIMARAAQEGVDMAIVDGEAARLLDIKLGGDGGAGGGAGPSGAAGSTGSGAVAASAGGGGNGGGGGVVPPERLELFARLCQRSASAGYQIPTTANRLANVCVTDTMKDAAVRHAETTRPLLPAKAARLCQEFLEVKLQHGSEVEQALYADLTLADFMDRLITKRPLVFYTGADNYLLKSGKSGADPAGWDAVGTDGEGERLKLSEVMSYDELSISALMAMSTPTHFINKGDRGNMAKSGHPGTKWGGFEPTGVYIGQVGARFERDERMEWKHMLVTAAQNTPEKGYGDPSAAGYQEDPLLSVWARFYGLDYLPSYDEAVAEFEQVAPTEAAPSYAKRAVWVPEGTMQLLNIKVFKRRMYLAAELFLCEANERASAANTTAYCHVVGLGLGVWQVHECQGQVLVDCYAEVLQNLSLPHVSDLTFSWFPRQCTECGGAKDGELITSRPISAGEGEHVGAGGGGGGEEQEGGAADDGTDGANGANGANSVRIFFNSRNPADKLVDEDEGKLLVAQYAWDSASYPGNEYWIGALSASGDPAAACCSTIPELQNPDVNTEYVAGANMHLAQADSTTGANAIGRM